MEYTEAHRVLLTLLRTVRSIDVSLLTDNFKLIAEHFEIQTEDPVATLRQYISDINQRIQKYHFKIEATHDQVLGETVYVFINTRQDAIIQGYTPYLPSELDAIKQLIDSIVASEFEFCVPYGNAKQQIASVAKLRLNDTDVFITKLVNDGWFEITSNNRIVLSTAALAELKVYLVDRFGKFSREDDQGKLLACHVCGGLVTYGVKCGKSSCHISFHKKCLTVFSRQKPDLQCPNFTQCSNVLEGDLLAQVGADP